MLTALMDNKVDFVSLFLNEGLKLRDFLTVDVLCSLYAGVSIFIVIRLAVRSHLTNCFAFLRYSIGLKRELKYQNILYNSS